ncbi:MAG TPA: polyhydroxyalkanoate synthesis regulator DNA-binding domain-containing protein [Steroidobacteraceae bacterium]
MGMRQIRKYPNRRLYDVEESRYVRLEDIRNLVVNKTEFTVVDKRSGTDITAEVLFQVVQEAELGQAPAMSLNFLTELIRQSETPMQPALDKYLEQSLSWFAGEYGLSG